MIKAPIKAEVVAARNPWFVLVLHNAVVGIYPGLPSIPARDIREWVQFTRSPARLYEVDIRLPRPQLGAHVRPEDLGWKEVDWDVSHLAN